MRTAQIKGEEHFTARDSGNNKEERFAAAEALTIRVQQLMVI